ncbi:MAG: DUF4214 domain-containing protein [Gemmatimonadales bacterium]
MARTTTGRRTLLGVALLAASASASAASVVVPPGATMSLGSGSVELACADLAVQGTLSVAGGDVGIVRDLSIASAATLDAGSGLIEVGGNWSNAGTFSRGTSTVVFADGCATSPVQLTGNTSFANLTLQSGIGRTFVLPAGGATTVAGILTLTGMPGLPIQVTSASPAQPAYIALAPGATVSSNHVLLGANTTIGAPGGSFGMVPATLAFGGQSMNTTAPSQAVSLTNASGAAAPMTSVSVSAHFAVTHDCPASLPAGASCTASVSFTPGIEGGVSGALTVVGPAGTPTVALTGTGERSLVTHYYRSILRRAPDAGGKSYWDGEAARMQSVGVNVNETWYSMAGAFYTSVEYVALNRDNNGFVTDLYNTFFNRPPDGAGLVFWNGLLDSGLPREVALVSFMFSTEFVNFTQAIFGGSQVRKEVDTVVDFYRGLLARLPDGSGLGFWVQEFRAAQCQGAAAVTARAEAISSAFALGAEYAARGRSNSQYVGDLYNAFLRRGGDLGGVQFWISEIASGARTREHVRQQFVASAEFSSRVAAVIAQGCLTP